MAVYESGRDSDAKKAYQNWDLFRLLGLGQIPVF